MKQSSTSRAGADPRPASARAGTITLVTGCMFSGKTTFLLSRLDQRDASRCRACKHSVNDRYQSDAIVSHGGRAFPARRIASAGELLDDRSPPVELIAVDDGHFFDIGLARAADDLARSGVDVVITALDLDSWGRPFPTVEALCDIADDHVSLHGVCAICRAPAVRTQRLTPIIDGRLVGGPEAYQPKCATCWHPPPTA